MQNQRLEIVHEPVHQQTLLPALVEPPDLALFAQLEDLHLLVGGPNPFACGRLQTLDESLSAARGG